MRERFILLPDRENIHYRGAEFEFRIGARQ